MPESTGHPLLDLLDVAIKLENDGRLDKAELAFRRIVEHPSTRNITGLYETANKHLDQVRAKLKPTEPEKSKDTGPDTTTPTLSVPPPVPPKNALTAVATELLVPIPEIEEFISISPEDRERLKDGIQTRGIQMPLIITPSMKIACGYTRYRIAQELGIKKVPVIVRDIPDNLMLEFAIRDNLDRRQLDATLKAELVAKLGSRPRGRRRAGDTTPTAEEIAQSLDMPKSQVEKARAFLHRIKAKPELEGKNIREVLYGKPEDHKRETIQFRIGENDTNMAEKIYGKLDDLLDYPTEIGDVITVTIITEHRRGKKEKKG